MKANWSSDYEGDVQSKFASTRNYSADGKELNTLVASTMENTIKLKRSLDLSLRTTLTRILS